MKKSMLRIWSFVREILRHLMRPHPQELCQGTHFQEEARSERFTNLVRFVVVLVLTMANMMWAFGNEYLYATFDLVVCLVWLALTAGYHGWLMRHPYRPVFKYASTTVDILVAMCFMIVYAVVEGPVFVFKTAIFIYLFHALGLAALRFHRNLALYASGLAVGLLGGMWVWLDKVVGITYGSRFEHAFGHQLNFHYLTDILIYTGLLGFLTGMLVMTLRRQMELRVAEAERAVREEERVRMAAGLAHEIRNPLAGIHGFTQLIQDEGTANPRHVAAILDEVKRLNEMVEGYLLYSRPFPVKPRMIDLVARVRDFCRRQSLQDPDRPLRFETEKPEYLLTTDPDAVEQMLVNLVLNARRYHPPHPSGQPIVVRLREDCRAVLLSVEDAGPGVEPHMVERLFMPFQTSGGAGTGLGLSMTSKIAGQLGGEVTYHPREQGGACFVLRLRSLPEDTHEGV